MRVRWVSSPRDCAGRLRETDVIYDDFDSIREAELLARGYLVPVTEAVTTPVAAVPTPKPVPRRDDAEKE